MQYEVWAIPVNETTIRKLFSLQRRSWAEALRDELKKIEGYRQVEIREVVEQTPNSKQSPVA